MDVRERVSSNLKDFLKSAQSEESGMDMPPNTPVIVDAGVQNGKGVKGITIGPMGIPVAYSGDRGVLEEAQVWGYGELKERYPDVDDQVGTPSGTP